MIFDEISDETIPAEILQKLIVADKGVKSPLVGLKKIYNFPATDCGRRLNSTKVSVEEAKTANEELQASANEELQASNEERRSTTEELETSKELQSVNEQQTTVNFELEDKVE